MARSRSSRLPEPAVRGGAALVVAVGFFGSYYAIAAAADPARGVSPSILLDAAIPLVPASIYVYASVYTAMLLPLFVVRCPELFRRTVAAYVLVIGVSLACHALWPVSGVELRPPLRELDPTRFTTWALRLNYTLDPPTNLFPSVHLAVATLAALVVWKARRLYGMVAFAWLAAVAVSVCTAKQHYVADGVAGLALGAGAFAAVVAPCLSAPPRAFGWRGPAAYLAAHSLVYSAAYAAFRAGFAPF